MTDHTRRYVEAQHQSWNAAAPTWYADRRPAAELSSLVPAINHGDRVLDIGCGNGWASRAMAGRGARVVALDFTTPFLDEARAIGGDVEYVACNVCDADDLRQLDGRSFDGAFAKDVLMNLPTLDPLIAALGRVLVKGGWFVFAVVHPAFSSPFMPPAGRLRRVIRATLARNRRVDHYLTPSARQWNPGHRGPAYVFHRPIVALLQPFFDAGFVLDALDESKPAGRRIQLTARLRLT